MLSPLLNATTPVEWWFAFKFNGTTFPCLEANEPNPGLFGGTPQNYDGIFSMTFASANSANPALVLGSGYLGTSVSDPLGATFNQVYHGTCSYVIWNDQFYGDPIPTLDAPWGHSKGLLAWDANGNGFVLQVSTPSWPASGSANTPRKTDGNTLGCVRDDDVEVSQHFFALKLTPADVATVLQGLANASVVTRANPATGSVNLPQIFNVAAGPANLATLAAELGKLSSSAKPLVSTLSSGVTLISKPADLHVPPWQLVSSLLGSVPLRACCWWADPEIPSTTATTPITCWASTLAKPGAVQVATAGTWTEKTLSLLGEIEPPGNHAKIGVSTAGTTPYCIFGDMNQQGSIAAKAGDPGACGSSQNGRGGMFFVMKEPTLWTGLTALLAGTSAPTG